MATLNQIKRLERAARAGLGRGHETLFLTDEIEPGRYATGRYTDGRGNFYTVDDLPALEAAHERVVLILHESGISAE